MSKPPKIVVPGMNRGAGIPAGFVLGRRSGHGPVELLNLAQLRGIGVATEFGVVTSNSQTVSIAHSETVSLSSAVSTVISGSVSVLNSRIDSLSTAVGGGTGTSTSLSQISSSLSGVISTNVLQSTSLSQISSSLSGAISSTTSLSTAVSTAISNIKPTECLIFACSDETTALTTGTAKITFRMPYAFTVTEVYASLTTAQTSGSIFTVDINEAGTTIISTKLTIDNTETDSDTAVTPAVISDSSLARRAQMTVDIDQVGDGTAKGLKVALVGTRT